MTRNDWGHAVGFGLEKAVETVVLSKGAGVASNALKASNIVAAADGALQFGNAGDKFIEFASKAQQPAGVLDVAVHGSPTSVTIGGQVVNHRVLSNLISQSPEFTGQPIRLISCNTGELSNGFAQNLSNKLGVPVSAPNNTIWAHSTGKLTIGATPNVNTGTFVNFLPGAH